MVSSTFLAVALSEEMAQELKRLGVASDLIQDLSDEVDRLIALINRVPGTKGGKSDVRQQVRVAIETYGICVGTAWKAFIAPEEDTDGYQS